MRRSKKPPRCKVCRERTEGLPLHEACVDEFVHIQREKKARKLEKAHREIRRKDRQRRAELKTIPDLIKEAQREFNAFIRARDQGKPCICCGKPLGEGDVGGGYDCGHYRSTGSAPHLRFDERNAAAQRKQCNRYGAGRAVDYRIGLIQRIGLAAVESLEADNAVHKWTREELIAIRDKYRTLVRQMKKDTE